MEEVRVLLVDDEELVRRSLEKTLLRAGFDVQVAGNVAEALRLFQQAREAGEPFDVAVLDLQMPDAEGRENANAGLDLLSDLLAIETNLPVVVLTAFDDVSRAKEAVRRGARAYLVKGHEDKLVEKVESILGH